MAWSMTGRTIIPKYYTRRADVSGVEKHIHHLERILNKTLLFIIAAAIILGLALVFVGYQPGH